MKLVDNKHVVISIIILFCRHTNTILVQMHLTLKHNVCLLLFAYLFITYTLNHVKIWNGSCKTAKIGN